MSKNKNTQHVTEVKKLIQNKKINQKNKLQSEESKGYLEGSTQIYGLPHFFGSQRP